MNVTKDEFKNRQLAQEGFVYIGTIKLPGGEYKKKEIL